MGTYAHKHRATCTAYEASQILCISFPEFCDRLQNSDSKEAKLERVPDDAANWFCLKSVVGLARARGLIA